MSSAAVGYYSEKLAADKLRKVYEIASPRIRQYLEAEIDFVLERIGPDDRVLELGCGYGRVLERLTAASRNVFGIDTSLSSLQHARRMDIAGTFALASMNAVQTAFRASCFDLTVCIQNGISAFKVASVSTMTSPATATSMAA